MIFNVKFMHESGFKYYFKKGWLGSKSIRGANFGRVLVRHKNLQLVQSMYLEF
jgi:hypothetical protein